MENKQSVRNRAKREGLLWMRIIVVSVFVFIGLSAFMPKHSPDSLVVHIVDEKNSTSDNAATADDHSAELQFSIMLHCNGVAVFNQQQYDQLIHDGKIPCEIVKVQKKVEKKPVVVKTNKQKKKSKKQQQKKDSQLSKREQEISDIKLEFVVKIDPTLPEGQTRIVQTMDTLFMWSDRCNEDYTVYRIKELIWHRREKEKTDSRYEYDSGTTYYEYYHAYTYAVERKHQHLQEQMMLQQDTLPIPGSDSLQFKNPGDSLRFMNKEKVFLEKTFSIQRGSLLHGT